MKSAFRVFGLTLALVAAFYSSASASPETRYVDCQYECPNGPWVAYQIPYEDCCGTESIPYPGGGECTRVLYTEWTGWPESHGTLGLCP